MSRDTVAVDVEGACFVQAILHLAQVFRVTTVAEGVEHEAQAARLRELGCDVGQGWHYARAMPHDELVGFLASFRATRQPDSRASVSSASDMIVASSSATGGRSSMTPTT